jgi:phosphoserine aminotransferase
MLDYGTHAAKRFNTPPVYPIYMMEKVCRWLDELGGVEAIHTINQRKAGKLYNAIDGTDFYRGTVDEKDRSMMNVTFRLPSEELETKFVKAADERGLLSLKGHRSVGGIRASLYNALPEEAVDALVDFMDDFEQQHG